MSSFVPRLREPISIRLNTLSENGELWTVNGFAKQVGVAIFFSPH
jgi:hypothetical protein